MLKPYDDKAIALKASYDQKILQAGDDEEVIKLNEEMQSALREINHQKTAVQQENSFIGKIGHFLEPVMRPLGFDWKMTVSLVAGAAAKEVVVSTMGVLYHSGDPNDESGLVERIQMQQYETGPRKGQKTFTPLVAFAFMIFVLIYFPCVAVISAIRKESGRWKWALFVATYTTLLAWISSFLIYQVGSLLI
jgi:ferrous iron transport protein B